MTAILDIAVLPAEVNSARMYSGAGSSPMLATASAWKGLAAELHSTAASYGSLLTALTSEGWHGPASASASMAGAAAPYVAVMSSTAVQAEQAAAQAETAVARGCRPTRSHLGNGQLRVRGAWPFLDHRHHVGTAKLDRPGTPAQPAVLNPGRHTNGGSSVSDGSRCRWAAT